MGSAAATETCSGAYFFFGANVAKLGRPIQSHCALSAKHGYSKALANPRASRDFLYKPTYSGHARNGNFVSDAVIRQRAKSDKRMVCNRLPHGRVILVTVKLAGFPEEASLESDRKHTICRCHRRL